MEFEVWCCALQRLVCIFRAASPALAFLQELGLGVLVEQTYTMKRRIRRLFTY